MKEARETAHKILESKENGIMNLVQQAWAEGKRNAELEDMMELVKQALEMHCIEILVLREFHDSTSIRTRRISK